MKPTLTTPRCRHWPTVAWLVTAALCLLGPSLIPQTAHAQGDFAAPATHEPAPTWPEKPVAFDEFVQQANHQSETVNQGQGVASLIGSTVGSASEMLGNLKTKIGQQTDQWLGNADVASDTEVNGGWLATIKQRTGSPDIPRMLGSLAIVIGGYLALVVAMRKFGGGASRAIPTDVVDVVGHVPYGAKQQLQLVRLGSKLLLLISGPDGTQPIGEITDPDEVDHLVSLCDSGRRSRSTRPTVGSAALQRSRQAAAAKTQSITNEGLAEVLRRLEQATNGRSASFEA